MTTRRDPSTITNLSSSPNLDHRLSEETFSRRFKRGEVLGSGSFGEVYIGEDLEQQIQVAIKEEAASPGKDSSLEGEYYRYLTLYSRIKGEIRGIPKMILFAKLEDRNVLVMELLGPCLEKVFDDCGRKFSLKTVLIIGLQVFERIELLHSARLLHRDIKPENFVIGRGAGNQNMIYVVDMGLSKEYIDENNRHIRMREGKSLTGTARYVSVRTHQGFEQGRRDDIESIMHLLIYFTRGRLPWVGLQLPPPQNAKDVPYKERMRMRYAMIGNKKKELGLSICRGLPEEFKTLLHYARERLAFHLKPDYKYIRGLLNQVYQREGFAADDICDWELRGTLSDEREDGREKDDRNKPQSPASPPQDDLVKRENY